MSRETLKNFLNLKGFAADSISPTFNQSGPASREQKFDLGKDAVTGEDLLDLASEEAGMLGEYLNYITENAENVFGIAPGNEEAAPSDRGESLVAAEEQGATDVFVEQGTIAGSKLNENSNSGYFSNDGENLQDIIDKTGNSEDSHRLLSSIEGKDISSFGETLTGQEGEDHKVTKAIHSVLSNNNRFANVARKNAFAEKGESISNFESGQNDSGTGTSQKVFGKFELDDPRVTLDQLKSVGYSLLYKSSGYDAGDSPRESMGVNNLESQIANEETFSSLITEDGYQKVDFRNLRSKYAKGAPEDQATGESTRAGRGEFLAADSEGKSKKSYGTNFNPAVNFSGKGKQFLKLKAAIACIALKKVTSDFIEQIGEYIKFTDLKDIQETSDDYVPIDDAYRGPGPHPLGMNRQLNSFELDMFKKTVLINTDYPYPACFEKGIEVFFGPDDDIDKIKNYDHVAQAPGYWLSIASSVLKSFDFMVEQFEQLGTVNSGSADKMATLVDIVKSNSLIRFANAAATVGDIFFKTNGGLKEYTNASQRPHNVDSMPTSPATRVGKSRDYDGESPLSLSWRQGSVPSMYLLPRNVVKASVDLNTIFDGASPVRGMMSSVLVKNTYMDRTHHGSYNRIPNDVAKRLEDKLEAEYVPFYIQDLRTNEVVSFHAFLSGLTDNIKANYTPVSGYGRMDPVQIYNSTSRTVGVTFILYSTSKEDFDSMWYKINKLITLLYPQWTQGTQLSSTGTDRFVQPFSQVLGASPIVRLRVGDVIKSNYSRFNLARMFGVGDPNINPIVGTATNRFEQIKKNMLAKGENLINTYSMVMTEIFYGLMGTPIGLLASMGAIPNKESTVGNLAIKVTRNMLSSILINGFVNPLGANLILRQLTDPNRPSAPSVKLHGSNLSGQGERAALDFNPVEDLSLGALESPGGYRGLTRVLLKANNNLGYRAEDGTIIRTTRPLHAIVKKKVMIGNVDNSKNLYVQSDSFKKSQTYDGDRMTQRIGYEIEIISFSAAKNLIGKVLKVDHQDLLPDPRDIFMRSAGAALAIANPFSILDYFADAASEAALLQTGAGSELAGIGKVLFQGRAEEFMQPENNPFTRALESTMGRGLAGVIDGFNFNWVNQDFTWETDYNSRAPRGVEISFNFQVIHDLPPGLDHSGYNRAPLYNVGSIMKEVTGDAHGDDAVAEQSYTSAGNSSYSKTGK